MRKSEGITVARYTAEHKNETRKRILETAGRRFKRDGIDGSGIAAIMSDAHLTNGAFYAHFTSKEDLVANVVADQMLRWQANLPSSPEKAELESFVRQYLSPQHRDNPETGCPNAALLDEIGRCDDVTRTSYTQAMQDIVGEVAKRLSPDDPTSARSDAIGLISILVATVQLARAVSDRAFSDEILESGITNAQAILGRTQRPSSTHSRKRSR